MKNKLSIYFWIAHAVSTFGSMVFLNKAFTLLFQNPLLSGAIQLIIVTVPIFLSFPQFKNLIRFDLRRLIIGTDLMGFFVMLMASLMPFSVSLVLICIFISTLVDSLQLSKKMSAVTFSTEGEQRAKFAGYFFTSQGIVLILSPLLLISFDNISFYKIILFNGFTYLLSAMVGSKIKVPMKTAESATSQKTSEFKDLQMKKNFSSVFVTAVTLGGMSVLLPLIYTHQSEITLLIRILCLSVGTIVGGVAAAQIWSFFQFRLAIVAVACTGSFLLLSLILQSTILSHCFAFLFGISMPSLEILLNQILGRLSSAYSSESDFHQSILKVGTFTKIFFGLGVLIVTTCIYFIGVISSTWMSIVMSFFSIIFILFLSQKQKLK